MFCGLPMSVAAEPTLAAHASPSRNGSGFTRRARHASIRTGATARQTTSLLNTAASSATAKTSAPSSAGGDSGSAARPRVTQP
jgi:hypothetical protein